MNHLSLLKQKVQQNKDKNYKKQLHQRACYTAKVLTKQVVEAHQPISNILSKLESVTKENIMLLLYRLQKIYQAKQDAQKILQLFLKLEHDPVWLEKSAEDQSRMWNRVASLIGSFETEHNLYVKFVFDGYNLKQYAVSKQQILTQIDTSVKLPTIGKESKRPSSPGYLPREAEFDHDSMGDIVGE